MKNEIRSSTKWSVRAGLRQQLGDGEKRTDRGDV